MKGKEIKEMDEKNLCLVCLVKIIFCQLVKDTATFLDL